MNYFQRYLAEEFAEDYAEGRISLPKALKLIVSVTGSAPTADSILAAYSTPLKQTRAADNQPVAEASAASDMPSAGMVNARVSQDDPDVKTGDVQFKGQDNQTLFAYLARPADGGTAPVVLVCHENRGLNDHIRDVARRVAKAGYVALAVDLLSRQGGTAQVGAENVPGVLANIDPDQFVQDFINGWDYLKGQPNADAERVGMVGFCFGGGVTWRVATKMPELRAAVPYYGPPPPVEELASIRAAVLAIYGGKDSRITSTLPAVEEAMQKYKKVFEKVVYPDADHAFNNDTGQRYNPQAANDAWARTLAWFDQYVRG